MESLLVVVELDHHHHTHTSCADAVVQPFPTAGRISWEATPRPRDGDPAPPLPPVSSSTMSRSGPRRGIFDGLPIPADKSVSSPPLFLASAGPEV